MKKKISFIINNENINENIFKVINNFLSKQVMFKEFLNEYVILMKMSSACKETKGGHVKKSFVIGKRRNNKTVVFTWRVSSQNHPFQPKQKNYLQH